MGIASSCMTAPPCSGCLPEGLYGRRTPLPPSIRLSPWGVRIAGRFLASAVLRSGRALRGYWRGLPLEVEGSVLAVRIPHVDLWLPVLVEGEHDRRARRSVRH